MGESIGARAGFQRCVFGLDCSKGVLAPAAGLLGAVILLTYSLRPKPGTVSPGNLKTKAKNGEGSDIGNGLLREGLLSEDLMTFISSKHTISFQHFISTCSLLRRKRLPKPLLSVKGSHCFQRPFGKTVCQKEKNT